MPPRVSIFMPVYNGEKFIGEALKSLGAQTFTQFEVVIVDDGSLDRTAQVAERFCASDKRFRLVSHPKNLGLSAARNTGWQSANPQSIYLMNHDCDDISHPQKLQKIVAFLDRHPEIAACGCLAEYIDVEGKRTGTPPLEWKPRKIRSTFGRKNSMVVSATIVRRTMFETIAPYRAEYKGCDDYDFWARALIAGYQLANVPETLHMIRIHPESMGAVSCEEMKERAESIQANYRRETRLRFLKLFGKPPA